MSVALSVPAPDTVADELSVTPLIPRVAPDAMVIGALALPPLRKSRVPLSTSTVPERLTAGLIAAVPLPEGLDSAPETPKVPPPLLPTVEPSAIVTFPDAEIEPEKPSVNDPEMLVGEPSDTLHPLTEAFAEVVENVVVNPAGWVKVPPGVMNPPLLPVQLRFPLSVKAPGPSRVPPLSTTPPTVLPDPPNATDSAEVVTVPDTVSGALNSALLLVEPVATSEPTETEPL